ncbi:multidrug resistance protein MdtE [Sideroxyarcus emersonii]|uniref:Multidrug resistance protein MdtE n=1 Tax=Sideroxyarcus emersonii TaxID=2764705 RepID=A0AAN2BZU7_9PROT|nr:efflux RND transporter periplasmic adaptor subunit [Sideroxyarcus emersonii]BCK88584.1 multidrug resistance protein MdtE [Sideroxyarcus emersonii]
MKLNLGLFFGLSVCLFAPVQAAEPLATAAVQLREVEQTYSIDGVVEATRQSTVSAQISGRVKAIYFDVGDRVSKGQVILRIDEREANQALAGSRAQLSQAEAALQNARLNYERSKQLFEQKFISQAALDKAKSDYEVAKAQAAASEAGAEQSALAQSYTSVLAPYPGVVAARLVELGEMVTVGKPLMTGFDPSQLRVIASVPQEKLKDIGSHPVVTVEVPSLERWIKAASVTVQPSADVRTHSTQVRVDLPANQANLYPGMFVRTHFVVGKEKKMLIPNSAVVHRSEVVAVYVVDEKDVPHLRQVRLGEVNEQNEIEVLAGLNIGERVARDAVKAGMAAAESKR